MKYKWIPRYLRDRCKRKDYIKIIAKFKCGNKEANYY